MTFDEAFDRLLGHEGDYSEDPSDRGNWTSGVIGLGLMKGTKWGISAAAYPDLDIKSLTKAEAKNIYRHDYWTALRAEELPAWLRWHAFDAAVNSGVSQAVIWIQRAVGAAVDGKLGPITIATAHRADPGTAIARFNGRRLQFMASSKGWATQGKGWARRVAANLIGE